MELTAIKSEITGTWDIPQLQHWGLTFANMVDDLKNSRAFKFARYGDGEIYCMKGRQGANCDSHTYFPDLGSALRKAVSAQRSYMVGIQPLSVSHLPQDVTTYFGHFKELYNADVLHNASIQGIFDQFMHSLSSRYIVLVGPAHLSNLFAECVHVVIPDQNCWWVYDQVREQIAFHIEGINNAVVLLSASMMSEVIIDWFEDFHHTFIDTGSVFDPYCGVMSRKYHYKLRK